MAAENRRGRPRKNFPAFWCPRVENYPRIFRWAISPADWAHMHRPMVRLYDLVEESMRAEEYGRILVATAHAPFGPGLDATAFDSIPRRILEWQHEQGILFGNVDPYDLAERRSEHARCLAHSIVAREVEVSEEALSKICRRFRS